MEGLLSPGRHLAAWDGRGRNGRPVASGVYLAVVQSAENINSKKITLIR